MSFSILALESNAGRIYQDLLQQIPRRKSFHSLDNPSLGQSTITGSVAHRRARSLVDQQDEGKSRGCETSSKPDPPTAVRQSRKVAQALGQAPKPRKKRSLAEEILHANHEAFCCAQKASVERSRVVPVFLRPIFSTLYDNLSRQPKSTHSKVVYRRTRDGQSLGFRLFRIPAAQQNILARCESDTILYIVQGLVCIQSEEGQSPILNPGESYRLSSLTKYEASQKCIGDVLILSIFDALNAYGGTDSASKCH